MNRISRILLILLIVLAFVGCDQATKSLARRELQFVTSVSMLQGLVRFQYAENDGAFLSIGSELPLSVRKSVAIVLTVIVVVGAIALLLFADKINLSNLVALSLLLAGSMGNLIDRLLNDGRVVDFLILGTTTIHTGILNVADLLITAGLVTLYITIFLQKRST